MQLDVKCVTFGSPRVGNMAFAREWEAIVEGYRVVNKKDVVPAVPPYLLCARAHVLASRMC